MDLNGSQWCFMIMPCTMNHDDLMSAYQHRCSFPSQGMTFIENPLNISSKYIKTRLSSDLRHIDVLFLYKYN